MHGRCGCSRAECSALAVGADGTPIVNAAGATKTATGVAEGLRFDPSTGYHQYTLSTDNKTALTRAALSAFCANCDRLRAPARSKWCACVAMRSVRSVRLNWAFSPTAVMPHKGAGWTAWALPPSSRCAAQRSLSRAKAMLLKSPVRWGLY
jgi:hypothetical protein